MNLFQPFGTVRLGLLLLFVSLGACVPAADPPRATVPRSTLPAGRTMVALVFGQSNAANSGQRRGHGGPGVYNFYAGKLHEAQDPLLGATGEGGSVWTRLGPKLLEDGPYDAVVFAPVAVGGTAIREWTVGGKLHPRLLETVAELKRADLTPTHLLWHQGEADNRAGTGADDYQEMFLAMLGSLRDRGVRAPAYVSVATLCGSARPNETLRAAQRGLVNAALNIRAGPDTDALNTGYRSDGCHFSAYGLERYAELWLAALSVSYPKAPQPLRFNLTGLRKRAADPAFSVRPFAESGSGLPVRFTGLSPLVCRVTENGTVTPLGAGRCTLLASQGGDEFYAAAQTLEASFPVTP